MKPGLKLAIVTLLPALLLLVTLEIIASNRTFREISVIQDPLTGEPLEYRMQIGRFPARVGTTPLNRMGFPDEDFPAVRKAAGCFHILLLGDSFTFGDTVDLHRSWASLLRRAILAQGAGRCIRVFNAGERASTIDRQLRHFRALRAMLEPDLVILGKYQNDLTDLTQTDLSETLGKNAPSQGPVKDPKAEKGPWRDVIRDRIPIPGAASIRFIAYRLFAHYIQTGRTHDILSAWSVLEGEEDTELAARLMETYETLFVLLVEELGDVPLGVVIFPSKMDVMAGRYPEGDFFRDLSQRHGIPHLDLMPTFLEDRRPYAFQMYDGHLNEHGNALVAEAVFEWGMRQDPAFFGAFERAAPLLSDIEPPRADRNLN